MKPPTSLENVIILGAGRYEYKEEFSNKYVIKNRGFSVEVKDKTFYSGLDLSSEVILNHRTFVTSYKATTNKYSFKQMGYLIDDTYKINPFNLGGKRVIDNYEVNLNKEYTKTRPIKLEKGVMKNGIDIKSMEKNVKDFMEEIEKIESKEIQLLLVIALLKCGIIRRKVKWFTGVLKNE